MKMIFEPRDTKGNVSRNSQGFVWKTDWVVKVVFLIQTLPTFGTIAITTFEIHR